MSNGYWIGVAPSCAAGGDTLAHVDAHILSALDRSGLAADLVCTHIDHSGPIAAITASARLDTPPSADALDALARHVDGTAVGIGPNHEPVTEPQSASEEAAVRAALAARAGLDGRCVRFPGQRLITDVHPAARIIADSAIEQVLGVGIEVTPEVLVDTRGFLRPQYRDHQLVLLVEPAAGGMLRPVELENPHQCCGGH